MSEMLLLYWLLGVAFFGILAVPVFQYVKRKRRDLFEPVYLGTLVFFLLFWVRSVYILIWGSDILGERPFPRDIIRAWNTTWLYLLLAAGLFFLSYYSKLGVGVANVFPPLPSQWNLTRTYLVILVLFSVGVGSFFLFVAQFGHGGLLGFLVQRAEVFATFGTGPLLLLNYCMALAAHIALILLVASRGRRGRLLFPALFLATLTVYTTHGIKGIFLFIVLTVLMLTHYLRRPLRWRQLLVFSLVAVFLVFPAFTALRVIGDLSEFKDEWAYYAQPARAADIAIQRFSGIDGLVYIIRDTPEVMDYQLGKTYLLQSVAWVPREIWPDKPVLGFGQIFTPLYLGHVFAAGGTTYGPTIFGEAYVNFHLAGIMLAAILGGLFLRAFYHYLLVRERGGLSGVFVYATTLPFVFVALEAHFAAWLITAWIFLVATSTSLLAGATAPPRRGPA